MLCEKRNESTEFIVKNIYKDQAAEANAEAAKRKLLELIRRSMLSEAKSIGGLRI